MIVIGLFYVLLNIALLEPRTANLFATVWIAFLAYLGLFVWLTYWDFWVRHEWVDAAFVVCSIPFTDAMRYAIATQQDITGWSEAQVAVGNAVIVVAFVSIIMTTSFRWFAIWAALFSGVFVFRLMTGGGGAVSKYFCLSIYIPVMTAALWSKWQVDKVSFDLFEANREAEVQKAKAETLLYDILPRPIIERIRNGETIADSYSDASVIFVDLADSSELARRLAPRHLIEVLNAVFSVGDRCAERHAIEKVKTIGDAYLAVAGAALPADRVAAIRFATDFMAGVRQISEQMQLPLELRIGIHLGPVIGGVIGKTRMAYDYWGDTMNVAARVQSAAERGGITVTEPVYYATRDVQAYGLPRVVSLKGIGDITLYDSLD